MRINLKRCIWVLTLAVGIGVGGGTLQAVGTLSPQDHPTSTTEQQDYSKNKTYQQGVREGRSDHARNLDHSKKRHFKKDDDQKAYEAGYQDGHGK
ncbi:MAG: hypothetical protein ABSH46_14455 [Bryobacteraceae bacterium]|jgi:hypothetical protein